MTPVKLPQHNFTFKKPTSMSTEECVDLSVYRDPEGHFSVSTWELSEEEVLKIMITHRLHIYIIGPSMPPISPTVLSPFK